MKTHKFGLILAAVLRRAAVLALLAFEGAAASDAMPVPASTPSLDDNIVLRWNRVMLDAIRTETTPPPLAARNLAILHLAIHAASRVNPTIASEEAVEAAARVVCGTLYPGQAGHIQLVAPPPNFLARSTSHAAIQAQAIACSLLNERESDSASCSVTYIPESQAGRWRRTAPFFRPPELPQWPLVRSFCTDLDAVPTLSGPPALNTSEFADACAEVDRLGRSDSPTRSAEQTLIARFWSDFSYTTTPPGHWNLIAAQIVRDCSLDVPESALLFMRLNVAMADAGIACWRAKYHFNSWRPITAMNAGSLSASSAQPAWCPLLPTPSHPEYPSGHSAFSGAAAEVLAAFTGSDDCNFTVTSDALPGITRSFQSFSAAANEISISRVYGGIHFSYGCRDGLTLGRAIGQAANRQTAPPSPAFTAPNL